MLYVSNNDIITINRGDSGSFTIELNIGTSLNPNIYTLQPNDKVYFGVMEPNQQFEDAIIKKVYTSNDLNNDSTLTINFMPNDTQYLLCGLYYYSIKLEIYQGEYLPSQVCTIIPKRKFFIED